MDINNFDIRGFIKEYYPDIKDNKEINNIYNQIKNLLSKISDDKESIYKNFPLDIFNADNISKFIYHMRNNIEDREFIASMKKINVDRNFRDFEIKDEEKISTSTKLFKEIPNYEPWNIKREMIENNWIIMHHSDEPEKVLKDLFIINETIIRLLIEEKNMFLALGLGYTNFNYIEHYIDYVVSNLLQIINFCIVSNKTLQKEDKINFLEILKQKTDEIDKLFDIQLNRSKEKKLDITERLKLHGHNYELSIEDYTSLFTRYVERRNFYETHINILKILKDKEKKQPKLFCEVDKQYQANKVFVKEEETVQLRNIITEGKKVDEYELKLNETKAMIEIFGNYDCREAYSNCLQDLKVYFREIFISKQAFKGGQSITIVRNFLNECEKNIKAFDKQSDYMFIREKIERGYYREQNLLTYYHKKNELQEKIYRTILKVYLFYDYQDILEFIYEFNNYMLKSLQELFCN